MIETAAEKKTREQQDATLNEPDSEQSEPERIRLYRFMKAKWATKSIETEIARWALG